jgi:hypothetical protein
VKFRNLKCCGGASRNTTRLTLCNTMKREKSQWVYGMDTYIAQFHSLLLARKFEDEKLVIVESMFDF